MAGDDAGAELVRAYRAVVLVEVVMGLYFVLLTLRLWRDTYLGLNTVIR